MKNSTKKLTFLSLMAAVAMLFSYLEFVLPPILPSVPGIKLGLPNIIIIFLLYEFSVKEAAAVSFIRIMLTSLLFGSVLTLIYSISGAILSLVIMWIFKKINRFSVLGVSLLGGVFHNLGQILAAALIMQTREIAYYMIILIFSGTAAGIIVGIAAYYLIKIFKRQKNIY